METRVHTQHRTHGLQYSIVQYSLCQVGYRTLSSIKYWICPPLKLPHATTGTPTCHHWNPHTPLLQPPPATTPTPTCHHSNPLLSWWREGGGEKSPSPGTMDKNMRNICTMFGLDLNVMDRHGAGVIK